MIVGAKDRVQVYFKTSIVQRWFCFSMCSRLRACLICCKKYDYGLLRDFDVGLIRVLGVTLSVSCSHLLANLWRDPHAAGNLKFAVGRVARRASASRVLALPRLRPTSFVSQLAQENHHRLGTRPKVFPVKLTVAKRRVSLCGWCRSRNCNSCHELILNSASTFSTLRSPYGLLAVRFHIPLST